MWKKLMIGAALAGMLAGPAMAQAWDPNFGSGNIVGPYTRPGHPPNIPSYGYAYGESNAYGHAHHYDRHHYVHRWDYE